MAKKKPTVFLGATIEPEVNEALEREAEKTGNKSFLVNKALRHYFGIVDTAEIKPKPLIEKAG